jgi:hypothetical protein
MLFSKSTRSLENIPPSRDALQEHTKRAVFQAGYVWAQATVRRPEVPSPEDWGWERGENGWTPTWTTLPEASKVCKELVRCGCKKSCSGLSRWFKASLPCTSPCYCAGNCHQQDYLIDGLLYTILCVVTGHGHLVVTIATMTQQQVTDSMHTCWFLICMMTCTCFSQNKMDGTGFTILHVKYVHL